MNGLRLALEAMHIWPQVRVITAGRSVPQGSEEVGGYDSGKAREVQESFPLARKGSVGRQKCSKQRPELQPRYPENHRRC